MMTDYQLIRERASARAQHIAIQNRLLPPLKRELKKLDLWRDRKQYDATVRRIAKYEHELRKLSRKIKDYDIEIERQRRLRGR